MNVVHVNLHRHAYHILFITQVHTRHALSVATLADFKRAKRDVDNDVDNGGDDGGGGGNATTKMTTIRADSKRHTQSNDLNCLKLIDSYD